MPEERRKDYIDINARLAVLESKSSRQREDVKEILSEIKNISAFIYEIKPRLERVEEARAGHRLTKIEARNRHIAYALGAVLSVAAFKDWIYKFVISKF